MPGDVALFWAVAAAFLLADNLVLAPAGGDLLRFRRDGRLGWRLGLRLEIRGRDLIVLNALDPFDRAAPTTRVLGPLPARDWRAALRRLRRARPVLNGLAWAGAAYGLIAVGLAVASARRPFGEVLAVLAGVHALFCAAAAATVLRHRAALGLSGAQAAGQLLEALFVPGYAMNLGKRLWHRQVLDLPALAVALHRVPRGDDDARALWRHEVERRLAQFEAALPDEGVEASRHCIAEARRCLTA